MKPSPNPDAVPELLARAPVGKSAVLIDLTQLERTLVLTGKPAELGKFYVELRDGERWLEAHLPAQRRVALALPLQSGSFLRTGDQEAEIPAGPARIVKFENLQFSPLSVASRGSIEQALRDEVVFSAIWARLLPAICGHERPAERRFDEQRARAAGDWCRARRRKERSSARAQRPRSRCRPPRVRPPSRRWLSGYFAIAKYHELQGEPRQREAAELRSAVIRDRDLALVSGALGVAGRSRRVARLADQPAQRAAARGQMLQFEQHF